jgi:hypothetical protein
VSGWNTNKLAVITTYDQRAAEAVSVITTSLSKKMTILFCWNQKCNILDPKAIWETIGRWFMEDSAIFHYFDYLEKTQKHQTRAERTN